MPEDAVRQVEIAVEQRHVDRVYRRLAEVRSETEAMRDRGYQLAHGADREAIFEQAQMLIERDVMVQYANKVLQALDAEHEGLVFGRLDVGPGPDQPSGEVLYVGRLGLRDAEFDNLVLDWRAPASAAFYQATAEHPMGVLRRRVIRCSRERVLDIDDDVLAPDALPEDITVVGEGALMASLGRARGDTMRDIVATIQKEQDDAIRAPSAGVTEITGGPGTGKTAVALHRAAYLLYRHRRAMTGAGVLVVGPSPVFTNYISRVLPSMGEDSAELRSLGQVLDGLSATRLDDARTAAVKGSGRMVRVLRRAMRQTPPDVPTEMRIVYRGEVLRLGDAELERVRRAVHRRGGQPNRSRVDAAEALLEALWHKAESYQADSGSGRSFQADHNQLVTELGERIEFHRFLVRWWPVLTPAGVLSWLGDRSRLAHAAGRTFDAAELDLLSESWAAHPDDPSVADVALLDELRGLLGEPRRRRRGGDEPTGRPRRPVHYDEYAHLVVDEAQDLSPMQWRMVGRRGRYASWTIVGDPLQSAWPEPDEALAAKEAALRSVRTRRQFVLRTNYRNSAEIFELAAGVLAGQTSPADLPTAVRRTGVAPEIVSVSGPDMAAAVRRAAVALLAAVPGTVGVITAMAARDAVAAELADVDAERLRVIGSLDAKGLEYDGVVVVAPERLVSEAALPEAGRRSVYVALTRATQQLTVVTTDPAVLHGG
ncbi:MAG TPA: ATP-binding domain-containing protein [Pseudonocardiaceae bacterium]|nr:ATP-binding domain-containing protein [Pseudonocardiaceae bacterium]